MNVRSASLQSLGLVISSNQAMTSNKFIEQKPIEEDEDEIIIDENQHDEDDDDEAAEEDEGDDLAQKQPQQPVSTQSRSSHAHLRCRQCDYDAEDLSDLLVHRKAHASMKTKLDSDRKHSSDIENDDQEHVHLPLQSNQVGSTNASNRSLHFCTSRILNNSSITVREPTA